MDDLINRRELLASTVVALSTPIAGCASLGDSQTSPAEEIDQLRFSAQMLTQSTSESPPKFQATLSNTGKSRVRIEYEQVLFYNGPYEPPEDFLVYPSELWSVPTDRTSGCWQLPPDWSQTRLTVLDILNREHLRPDEAFPMTLYVLSNPDNDGCFPPGQYTVSQRFRVGDEEMKSATMELTLQVKDNGRIAVSADDPFITRETTEDP